MAKANPMKYKVNNKDDAVDINVSEAGDKKERLIKAVQDCTEGRCTCPSQEYDKVESVQVTNTGRDIRFSIKAKDGEVIDKNEVEKCLDYMVNKGPED